MSCNKFLPQRNKKILSMWFLDTQFGDMNITLRIKSCIGKLHVSTLQENVIVISSCVISALSSATLYFPRMLYLAFVKAIYARPATFRFVSQDSFGEVRGVPTSHWWSWVHPGRGLIAISHKRKIKLLMYQEKSWHLDHFTCSSCFRPLAGKDYTLEVSSASQ